MRQEQRIIMWLNSEYGEGNENVKIVKKALERLMHSEWHDLRKNPSDTPKPEHVVEIAIEVRCSDRTYEKRVFGYYEDGTVHTEDSDYFWTEIESFGTYCEDTDDYIIPSGWFEEVQYIEEYDGNMIDDFVVAWREIEPYEVSA